MADAIVSLVLERISDLLIHEAVFLKDVKEQVESLKAELKRMQCFLEDADRKPEQDKRLRNRVSEIRDLAYDAEDVIESFILTKPSRLFTRFTSVFTKRSRLRKIGVQVKAIQTKLENISKSLPAYDISGHGEGSSSVSRVQQRLRITFSHVEEEDVVSLEVSTKDVVAQLMTKEDKPHAVVSIVGMGGLGKTTLARKVYNHVEVTRHFDCRAWVFISQQCNPREVLREVLKKVICPSKEERELIEKLKENELTKKLFDVLKEKMYLVVLDDIWRSEDWDILKPAFPRGKQGSKILLTTRDRNTALQADPWHSPMELPFLTDDESWYLLSRKAFPRNNTDSHVCSGEFEKLGRVMVKKCGGLPLAIVVLGGMLATKHSVAQWETVHRNIHGHLKGLQHHDHQYGALNRVLALSYIDLPYYLKSCFLYIGLYPEDWEISKKELIRLWIAEGFISSSPESTNMLMEDVGEQFLEELIDRSLVQIGSRDYTREHIRTCRIHDLLRDLCVEKAKEEKFLKIIHPADSVDVTLAESMLRRIAIHPSKRDVSLKGEHTKLRSLLLFQNEGLIKLHISKCKSFRSLRVLTVVKRYNSKKWHVSSEIGNLHHLRYLKLQAYCDIILPRSIGRLKNLHTLYIIYYCRRGVVIPNVLFKLERLRHFVLRDLYNYHLSPETCPASRFTSKSFVTLKHIVVDKKFIENNTVSRLTDIQSLGLIFRRSEDVMPILMSLIELHRLGSLCMSLVERSYPELEPLFECHHVSKLKLIGWIREYPHPRPHALSYLPPSIVKLTLADSLIEQDPMGVLEKLPYLRILSLRAKAYAGSKMICSANGFPELDFLRLEYLDKLEEWEIEEGTMPRLRSLHLVSIPRLERLPEGLRYITTLQELKLYRMKSSLVERIEVRDGREGEDFYKVRHIPSITISAIPKPQSKWA